MKFYTSRRQVATETRGTIETNIPSFTDMSQTTGDIR